MCIIQHHLRICAEEMCHKRMQTRGNSHHVCTHSLKLKWYCLHVLYDYITIHAVIHSTYHKYACLHILPPAQIALCKCMIPSLLRHWQPSVAFVCGLNVIFTAGLRISCNSDKFTGIMLNPMSTLQNGHVRAVFSNLFWGHGTDWYQQDWMIVI